MLKLRNISNFEHGVLWVTLNSSSVARGRSLFLWAIGIAILLLPLPARGMVNKCGDCICITWIAGGSATVEVRCPTDSTSPSGWQIGDAPPDGSNGSMNGDGTRKDPPQTLPGMSVTGELLQALNGPKGKATTKLRGTPTGEPGIYEPNDCTQMFDTSPIVSESFRAIDLMTDYVIFRNGTGVKDRRDVTQCNTVFAWTECCEHTPIIFLCPERFTISISERERTAILLEELIHVAGQMEDKTSTVGPNDPPNSAEIRANIKDACGLN